MCLARFSNYRNNCCILGVPVDYLCFKLSRPLDPIDGKESLADTDSWNAKFYTNMRCNSTTYFNLRLCKL